MDKPQQHLLDALRAALTGGVPSSCPGTPEEWRALLDLAAEQRLLPLVLDVLVPAARTAGMEEEALRPLRREVIQGAVAQGARTRRIEGLCAALDREGLRPLLVKGLACRRLYPKPDLRLSGDEDLLARDGDLEAIHRALTGAGLVTQEGDSLGRAQVVTYADPATGLRLELHRRLFPEESEAYGGMNACFAEAFRHPVSLGEGIWTLCPQEHLLYLILHSLKHFLHSGFGIRQVCDICLAGAAWGAEVDWPRLFRDLEAFQGGCFAAGLFTIGEEVLGLGGGYPAGLRAELARDPAPDVAPLLEDLLSGGVYGGNTEARRHSSLITLHAAEGKGERSLLRTVFPSAKELSRAYPYLEKAPWQLPRAWASRVLRYAAAGRGGAASAPESLAIGERRVALLRKYKVIR